MSTMTAVPGAYDKPLEKITTTKPYIEAKDGVYLFKGQSLEVRIPMRYRNYGMLDIEKNIETLGLFDMIIDDRYQVALNILAKVTLCPEETEERTILDDDYLICRWTSPGIFIASNTLVQDFNAIYCAYVENIDLGHRLYNVGYLSLIYLFDRAREFTGSDIGTDRSTYELLVSHLARDADNMQMMYRYTDMKKPPTIISMRSTSFAPTSTTARIIGAYRDDGMAAALNYKQTTRQPFEDLLRGLPAEKI